MNLFHLTFPRKGLKRSCTIHEGCFEMIGERNSKQSTGSLLILPKKVNEHQYYRECINLNLLPHARNIINELMEQTIMAGYSSGESIMHFMKRNLHKRDAKTICYNTIITQRNFFNTIHLDKKSIFSEDAKHKVLNNMMLDHHIKKRSHANRYVTNVMKQSENNIPKSTTCCWKLCKNYEDWTMYQYFVSPQYNFGLNISSNTLSDNKDVGATFMSSLFYHATTIPIWKNRINDRIYLEGPQYMYNFAWGSNGTNKEK